MSAPSELRSLKANDKACAVLAKAAADARRGDVSLVAIVAIMPDGPKVIMDGEFEHIAGLNLGVDMLKAMLMQQICGAPQSSILRPGH